MRLMAVTQYPIRTTCKHPYSRQSEDSFLILSFQLNGETILDVLTVDISPFQMDTKIQTKPSQNDIRAAYNILVKDRVGKVPQVRLYTLIIFG